MKNKRVLSLVFFLGINLSFLFASDKLEEKTLISSNDTLLVEVEGLPPFIFFDDENHLQGYAVELIDSVAAKLGKPVKFILSEKKSSISIEGEVQSTNRIHPDILFVNSITSTYDSNEYNQGIICFQSKQALMVRRWSGIEKISDLSRKKITSVDSRWILEQFQSMGIFPKLPMISPDKLMDMNLFLLNKTVDASVADIQVQKYLLQKNVSGTSSLRIIPLEAIPVFYQLMVRVDSKRVTRDQVQKIMSTFNREKTTLIMQRKWFDFSPQNELLTLNRLLSIVLAILIIISLALFFIYLAFLGENTKTKRYTDLMINAFDVFPHVVNLSEIDKKGASKKIIYRNHLIQQNFDKLDLEQEGAENARQNRTETKDDSLREVNGRYFKKCSFLMDQKKKSYKMDIYSDVTGIIESRKKSDLAKKLKSTYLANMSHDIRTPLNSIIGFSQLLTETQSREELQDYSQLINDNTQYLVGLIDDIVKLTQYKNKTIELYEQDINFIDHRHYLSLQFKQSLQKHGKEGQLKLVFKSYYSEIYLRIDLSKYLRVIMNLINNSIKFTNKGSIEVGMFVEDEQLYFYVEDTGIGIAADKIPIIFNAYESMDSISQSKGTGLGMAICIAVMRLMGGTVGVYSEVGIGSLFWCSHKPPMLRAKLKEDADNISLQLIKDKIHKSYLLK